MRNALHAVLLLVTGWVLGWYMHGHFRHEPATPVAAIPAVPSAQPPPVREVPDDVLSPEDEIQQLLSARDYVGAVEFYEVLVRRADETAVRHARQQLLGHARDLLETRQYPMAKALLERLLVAAWRDVETRVLLAELAYRQGDVTAAVEQLYEARGHAWDQETLERLLRRIRGIVNEQAAELRKDANQAGLLELYRRLTQLEPDHAPYFIGLAGAQLELGYVDAARTSLELVVQDPDYGAQAATLLAGLQQVPDERYEEAAAVPAADVGGIPLQRRGTHFLVEARPGRGGSLNLLIDTGASMTIVTPGALERHGILYTDTGRTGIFSTANGRVSAPVYRVGKLAVGDWEVRQLEIGVLDLGNRTDIDGLLGMNFLRHFQFFIDQNRSWLRLSLRERE
jgi:clan AA aspartic protease (TIGR02281 family)